MSSQRPRHQTLEPSKTLTRISHLQIKAYTSLMFLLIVAIFSFTFFSESNLRPGDALPQASATIGTAFLLTPLLFSIVKRSGLTINPPRWFSMHVAASMVGVVFVSVHVSHGKITSIPGILYLILLSIICHGVISRIYLSKRFSQQFGSREESFYTSTMAREILSQLIADKIAILEKLDKNAEEGLFSPNLRHASRHPLLTFKYVTLASRESRLVGARRRAGRILSLWRPLHMLMAIIFILGAITHTITVIFFAGYVAGDDTIYWWHLASWGGRE